jgi:hypothetical protein
MHEISSLNAIIINSMQFGKNRFVFLNCTTVQSLQCNTRKQERTWNEERKINITAEFSNEHFHFLTTFVHFQLKIITVFSNLNTTCKPIHCYYKF